LSKKELLICVGIFGLALFVRLLYLYQSAANPSFRYPIVDSATYNEMARALAAGQGMSYDFFWQSFFYPFFLSVIYFAAGSSIICVKVIQILLGCFTCLLTYFLGRKIFGRNAGVIAAVTTAIYGPLIFLEAELLAAGWAAFWSVVLIILFLNISSGKSAWRCAALGICGAMSIITRPDFVLFFVAAVVWLAITFYKTGEPSSKIALRISEILAGFLLIAIPVAFQNFRVTGHFGILPASGGINFYIGNNPNYKETLTARPGEGWEELVSLPERNDVISDLWAKQNFFNQRVINYITDQPFAFAKGLAYKTVQFLSSREIPRNIDIYMFRKWSSLLGLLVWKAGGFGFPFGILLILMLFGIANHRRQLPAPLLLFIILYPLSIIFVFVASRYRVPAIPVFSVIAAAGLLDLIGAARHLRWRSIGIISVITIAVILLSSLPGPFPQELPNYQAEFYRNLASVENKEGNFDRAFEHCKLALELMPQFPSAYATMGDVLTNMGEINAAISYYNKALQLRKEFAHPHIGLGRAYFEQGRLDQTILHLTEALRLNPGDPDVLFNLATAFAQTGKLDQAIEVFSTILHFQPNSFPAHNNLGYALLQKGNAGEAVEHFRQAVKINPDFAQAQRNLGYALSMQGNFDEAIEHFYQALRLEPDSALAHYMLAQILQKAGRINEAETHFNKARQLDPHLNNAPRPKLPPPPEANSPD